MKRHKNFCIAASCIVGILSGVLLLSCDSNHLPGENELEKAGDNICFGVSRAESVLTGGVSGSEEEDCITRRFVLRNDGVADTLCVRATVSDGCGFSGFDGEQTVTRSAPITSLDAYGSFNVLAYWKKGNVLQSQFYMDEAVTNKGGDVWSTLQPYYWPGAGHTLRFYAYAPADAGIVAPDSPESTVLSYTVPAEVGNQKDIVVATTDYLNGNSQTRVPLTFKHICTAVRFVVGGQIQPGTVKSITLKGIKNSGAYDMSGTATPWTLAEGTAGFSQTLDKVTSGSETDGAEITTAEGTFMMLPQVLADGATVEVAFRDNQSNQDRTLSASIAGTEWPIGKTVTYKLSITPEYDMDIEVPEEKQDAHYISFPITVNVKDYTGNWKLTSNLPDAVYFTQIQTELQRQGYWIDEDKGNAEITGTGSGVFTYYVYVTENIGNESRNIEFQVAPVTTGTTPDPITATVEQLCPSWNGMLGCERIEDGDYPWGFKWEKGTKITYKTNNLNVLERLILGILVRWEKPDYVVIDGLVTFGADIIINFDLVPTLDVAKSMSDGCANTNELYNFEGISDASNLMSYLESWGCVPDKQLPQNPTEFAARSCAMKNKFNKVINEGAERAVLNSENLVWYLPAKDEASQISDSEFPLFNDKAYWTSTAVDDNATAYKFVVGGGTDTENRATNLHVRAVRKKPAN